MMEIQKNYAGIVRSRAQGAMSDARPNGTDEGHVGGEAADEGEGGFYLYVSYPPLFIVED